MARDKKLIVGNWKMNLDTQKASIFLHVLDGLVRTRRNVEVVIAPSILTIQSLSLQVDLRKFKLAAQNFYWRDDGAFTGEVSATQLRGIVQYGIVGHSERRHIFHEGDKDIRNKVQAAVRNNIVPILCIGETTWERSSGETNDVLHDQLVGGLANITTEDLDNIVIAYEPVWAIGTGQNANPADVVDAVRAIRGHLRHLYGAKVAEEVRVLYGGSVKPSTAADYLALPEIDGLLIGGASLDAHGFSEIAEKAHKMAK